MISVSLDFAKRIIRTFRVKCLKVNFDTGDYILNSQLFPLLVFINHRNIEVSVNYTTENSLMLVMHNRLARILWHAIMFYFKLKKI